MDESYIFTIGKPDFGAGSIEHIHALGLKAGLLLDKTIKNPKTDGYDIVVPIDFDQLENELVKLADVRTKVVGLLCTYENYILSKAKLGEYFNVPAISEQAARYSTDKALMRRAFEAYDTSITPAYAAISNEQDALAFAEQAGFPVIIKPTNLVKSLLVIRCDSADELVQNVRYAQSEIGRLYEKYHIFDRQPQLIIEQFITGPMYSIAAYVDAAGEPHFAPGVVSLISAQALGRDDNYLYRRQLPAVIEPALEKELFRVAYAGVKALGLSSSAAHIELIAGPIGVKLVEIGARTGGYRPRMYKRSYGIDLVETEIALALNHPMQMLNELKTFTAVYELFPSTEGKFAGISGQSNELLEQVDYYSLKVEPGQLIGPAKNGYKASLVIIISHPDAAEFDRLSTAIDALSIEVTP